ncbi:hypothetical protein K2P97_00695 [bacterium]|nr:hypothetical protein [bacterium]
MKLMLLVLSIVSFGVVALAQSTNTEANWFSPQCKDCPKMLTPGTASLGNNKGVYRPDRRGSKKKPSATPPTAPAGTDD